MADVFINYRTGDGEKTAALLDTALSHRFGDDRVFRASKSIRAGESFPPALRNAVRRCGVLLAVVGPGWGDSPRLHRADDWVREEILEAFACSIPVVPVLDGRTTKRLSATALPEELARLADVQSLRFDHQNAQADLARIGDAVAELVPRLAAEDAAPADSGAVHNAVSGGSQGTVVQSRDFTGTVGVSVHGSQGPVHAGTGDQYVGSQHFSGRGSGAGAFSVSGGNEGGIRQHFGTGESHEDEER
ncbi:toll/interleukin-1 receptor domain-containing protein [Streptomyces caatingaensis]|uniref:TIR domain-containing protein n=1 Tax=Streptomyces caatingaensis TaxID=1678637 RepID=A0A0K9X9J5_9ACTN|nr:toll/interleukin-1 receptor domain-containing protein [Streptomyces caatingaensis]KNB49878.1 hypothetical protein AC230_24325 [Streptomyces caatingaensis]